MTWVTLPVPRGVTVRPRWPDSVRTLIVWNERATPIITSGASKPPPEASVCPIARANAEPSRTGRVKRGEAGPRSGRTLDATEHGGILDVAMGITQLLSRRRLHRGRGRRKRLEVDAGRVGERRPIDLAVLGQCAGDVRQT